MSDIHADMWEWMREAADRAMATQPRGPQVGDPLELPGMLSARIASYDAVTKEFTIEVVLPGYAPFIQCTVLPWDDGKDGEP